MAEKRTDLPIDPRARRLVAGLAAVALLALLAGVVGAQTSGSYDLSWYSLDNGNRVLVGAHHGMAGTLGESLPGWAIGDNYALAGGYASGFMKPQVDYRTYLPIVFHTYP